jgi:hypothetical protein
MYDSNNTSNFRSGSMAKEKEQKIQKFSRMSQRIPKIPKKRKILQINEEAQSSASKLLSIANQTFYHVPNLIERELNKHTAKLRSTGVVKKNLFFILKRFVEMKEEQL